MVLYCFKCHQEVVFDAEHIGKNGRKIPLDPTSRRPHDCPEREKKIPYNQFENTNVEEDKNDHGNEDVFAQAERDGPKIIKAIEQSRNKEFVDHTAKGQQKVKFFIGTKDEVEEEYNGFRYVTQGKINVFGTQLAADNGIIYFSLNYEETA